MQFDLKLPLLGFEAVSKMELQKIDDIFMRLESVGEGPSFTLVNPFALREYSFDIPASLQALMEITPESNLLIYNIMILQRPIEKSTINFVAPIVFNTDNQTMAQIIVDNRSDFGISEPISNYLKGTDNV
ncbi:MAG: flagellar biosynthesis protein FliW [Sulfuricurvum sp. PD_MW2]|jgi:flagellar assembly factor FliW|uniref:flagellar assembly protein FliW n=1 Tax=Sulfuricurvum sp. PD_MW2 TaxID=2027917 RepID=UPI000C0620AC|nr:flagellar assembly protein FliW [Sulfuricurvum sp. PD_MW2]PHM18132.1 MAG: flagellar biosynthesis protein FliW [Sulfuricurvum sp. PD_MW2]